MLEILKNKPGVQEHIVSVDVLTAMGHYSDKWIFIYLQTENKKGRN